MSNNKNIYKYIVVSFGITWFCWILALILGYEDKKFTQIINGDFDSIYNIFIFILFRMGVYGPLFGGVLFAYKEGWYKKYRENLFRFKINFKYYFIIVLIPILINFLVIAVSLLLNIPRSQYFNINIPLIFIPLYFLYEFMTSGLEELGWRGYLIEKLSNNVKSMERLNWILGFIWALWHYPYVIYLYISMGFGATVSSIVGFTLAIIGQSFIFSWLYFKTKSIFACSLFHTLLNFSTTIILGSLTIVNPILGVVPAFFTWILVMIIYRFWPIKLSHEDNEII